jgi:membrane-associated phospholipid phosphatase
MFVCAVCIAQEPKTEEAVRETPARVTMIFHNIGGNIVGSVAHNYGLNFVMAGAGTWAFIETGLDWQIDRFAYRERAAALAGLPMVYIGYAMPFALPAALYLTGLTTGDEKARFAAFASVQAAGITFALQSVSKLLSGRADPGIIDALNHRRDGRSADFSGEFTGPSLEIVRGWPSGHTALAFAEAALLSEFYPDNAWVRLAAYSYAALMGIGVSFNVHWASDALAGALIGYAVGKTVGKSFMRLYEKTAGRPAEAALVILPGFVGMRWSLSGARGVRGGIK